MDYQTLIGLIKQECRRQNMSAYKLSQISGIPASTIYGIFRGDNKAQIDTICQMLRALGLQMKIETQPDRELKLRNDLEILQVEGLSREQMKVLNKLINWLKNMPNS